eukprot:747175-Hanusia_phi.AAC.6
MPDGWAAQEAFDLQLIKDRPLLVKGCCALTGETRQRLQTLRLEMPGKGIEGGLSWLVDPNSSQDFKELDSGAGEEGEQMC